jgi:hypothetical protein
LKRLLIPSALWCAALFCATASRGADAPAFWIDPDTHLMWTAADNGSGLSWLQAQRYCRDLAAGGFHNWKLPSIDDLQRLVGPGGGESTYRIKAPIKLTGWQWSSTPGKQNGEGWALDFGDGGRASVAAGDSGLNRALCIRSTLRNDQARKK